MLIVRTLYYPTLGARRKSHSTSIQLQKLVRWQAIVKLSTLALWLHDHGSPIYGSTPAVSTNQAVPNYQKQLIRCINGIGTRQYAMYISQT